MKKDVYVYFFTALSLLAFTIAFVDPSTALFHRGITLFLAFFSLAIFGKLHQMHQDILELKKGSVSEDKKEKKKEKAKD